MSKSLLSWAEEQGHALAGGRPPGQRTSYCAPARGFDAVECAVILQRGMAERNAGLPPDSRIDVRVGVHCGDVIVEERIGMAVPSTLRRG